MQTATPWLSSLFLDSGETLITSWKGKREIDTLVTVNGNTQPAKGVEKGVLVLTSQKLIWVEEKGVFGKSYHPQFAMKLENLRGVSMGGSLFKHVTIADDQTAYKFYLVGEREFPGFRQGIMNQIAQRKATLENQKKQERVHIMLDFSFLKQYMEKGGLMLQTVKCINCGAPMKIPETGNTVTCDHCHTESHVQDIFEKVKALIG